MTCECRTCQRMMPAVAMKAGSCITCHFNIALGQTRRANRLQALLKEAHTALLAPPAFPGTLPDQERELLERIEKEL